MTDPFVGYRVWFHECGYLRSVVKNVQWPLRKPLERDPIQNEGIHAVKDAKRVLNLMGEYSAHIAGSVYLWGKVEEFTEGYTADFAYPKELWMPEESDPTEIMRLEDNYGVPVKLRADIVRNKYIGCDLGSPSVFDPAGILALGQMQASTTANAFLMFKAHAQAQKNFFRPVQNVYYPFVYYP